MKRHRDMKDFDYEQLDPGIRRLCRWLHDNGYVTCDSGDGVTKFEAAEKARLDLVAAGDAGASDEEIQRLQVARDKALDLTHCSIRAPHVFIQCYKSRMVAMTDELQSLLESIDISVKPMTMDRADPYLDCSYNPASGTAIIQLMNVDDDMLPAWVGVP